MMAWTIIGTSTSSAVSQQRLAPSFNCAAVNGRVEKTICDDPNLSEADALMARLYASAKVSAFGRGTSNELATQRKWLKEREVCRDFDRAYASREECLRGYYRDRNQALAIATLFSEPTLALATLYKLDPEAAPLFEAIQIFASEPAGSNWSRPALSAKRDRLLNRLEIYFLRFRSNEHLIYGRSILEGAKIERAEDALKSDENFAQFVQISSAYLGDDPIPRQMPCAAILRSPGLLDATGATFGSTLDNFIIYPDCEETLPPLPSLASLVDNVWKLWPDCDGSIRFAGYRIFGTVVNGARVASRTEIQTFAASHEARRGVAMPRRKGLSPKLASDAFEELASYYPRYQGVSSREARLYAASMVREIGTSSDECS
jgi:uncharacterized protein